LAVVDMDELINSVSDQDRAEIFLELSEYVEYKRNVFLSTQGVTITTERKKKKSALKRPSTEFAIKHLAAKFIERTTKIFEIQRKNLERPVTPVVNKKKS
jgi:hypothetical protein